MLLTLAEAATTLRLHPVTLRALAAAGGTPAFKVGRAWRFVEIDIHDLSSIGGSWRTRSGFLNEVDVRRSIGPTLNTVHRRSR